LAWVLQLPALGRGASSLSLAPAEPLGPRDLPSPVHHFDNPVALGLNQIERE